jgi:hypothetical protein
MTRHRRSHETLWILAALALVWGAAQPVGAAEPKIPEKTKKQMRVMEGMLDSILLDSPNLLVSGSNTTHSLYLDEFGVVLAFEASLTGGGFDFSRSLKFLQNIRVESDKDKTVIWHEKGDGDEAEGDDSTGGPAEKQKRVVVLRDLREGRGEKDGEAKEEKSEKEIYALGKQELIDALADYGETISSLRDDQWLAIAAFLKDSEYFKDQQISRLVVKARMRDLRASNLSREELLGRIVVEEY